MESYICDRCSKGFRSNAVYTRHLQKITPCANITETTQKKKLIRVKSFSTTKVSQNETPIKDIDEISSENDTKKELGQFYTTNYKYILQNFTIPKEETIIIEPFAGQGDLLNFVDSSKYTTECYDLDPKMSFINKRDTLDNPPSYKGKFIITNPPYLARNKSKSKDIFDKHDTNDLYKCFMKQIIDDPANGGILIIPLNFWCSIRKSDIELRRDFLNIYNVNAINIFEERVFDDTSYSTCSFQFAKKSNDCESLADKKINVYIYPQKEKFIFELNESNNYTFGGEIYNLEQSKNIIVERLTKDNIKDNKQYITNILVKCIDDSSQSKISLSIVSDDNIYIDTTPNLSARSYAGLLIKPKLSIEQQTKLVDAFNTYINIQREKYNSLFLTNYRESNTIARKRISFSLAFEIVNYLIHSLKIVSQ